jgi:hypothetical protein
MALAGPQSELDPSVNRSRVNTEETLAHSPGPQELQAGSPTSFKGVIALPDESLQLKLHKPIADNADPLILSENDINSVHNCAGRDMTIEASNHAGICRSVAVVGSDDNVMIEISNRGKLTVLGERNVVLRGSDPEGPGPTVIRGDGSNTEIHLPSPSDTTFPLVTIEATRLASVPTTP